MNLAWATTTCTPVEVRLKDSENMKTPDEESTEAKVPDQATTCTGNAGGPPLIPPHAEEPLSTPSHIKDIDLSGLNAHQKEVALKLLTEEAESFARDDSDVGCIRDLELNLDLEDQTPVQKNYVAVPKPLYPEVKAYIEDLLNRDFIRKSSSSYSSPVVCVRKKDQSLRLCVDYRALNKKTRPDRHPIPRIQETLDNLGGNSWFSVLDQGKAYHQGFMSAKSQPYTAFITPWGLYKWVRISIRTLPSPRGFRTIYGELSRRLTRYCLYNLSGRYNHIQCVIRGTCMLNIHAKSYIGCESMELNSNRESVNCSKKKLYFLDAWCLRRATS